MLTKPQFSDLLKNNFMWPSFDWYLRNTSNGLESASNEYIDGVIEIIIDYLYQRYNYIQQFTEIIDVNKADSDKEVVGFKVPNSLVKPGDLVRIYNTQNYNEEYEVTDYSSDTMYVGSSYIPEILSNKSYYTIVSLDRYTESESYPFESDTQVIKSISNKDPVFLPHIGYQVGLKYDSSLSIDENRNLIKSAIDIYRIKGSILSIKRVMKLLGYPCEVVEPHKQIMRYGVSKYNFIDHYQDWKYYHNGVFEVVTENISLNKYKDTLSSLVKPVGTRLVARANLYLGLIPFLGDILTERSNSFFTEAIVRMLKAGAIFDEITHSRTRSGDVELFGIYDDVGTELGEIVGFRRVWDSKIYSLSDLSTPNIMINPAGKYSVTRGAFSGETSTISSWTSPYDESSQLDLQLDLVLTSKNERPAMRSEFAKRSGEFAMSGLDGDSWTWKPYYLIDYNVPLKSAPIAQNYPIDILTYGEGRVPYSVYSGDILSVNRWASGVRSIYGMELSIDYRGLTPEDWAERIYWSWDDLVNLSNQVIDINLSDQTLDISRDPSILLYNERDQIKRERDSFSGDLSVHDIDVFASE